MDDALVETIRERLDLARTIGREKKQAGTAIRDFQQEADVLERARAAAEREGVRPELVEDVFEAVIEESLHVQEEVHTHARYTAGERSAAVVGGAGKMGRWFASFLSAQGYRVSVLDPEGAPPGFDAIDALDEARTMDLVVVSVPVRATRDVLADLEDAEGLVVDIASIKAPFADLLEELGASGGVASIHPLWGPATRSLAGRNLLVMDCGDPDSVEEAKRLFAGTLARPIVLPLSAHDPAMASTLGLAHALNIFFAELLVDTGRDVEEFAGRGGSTFLRQARLARDVVAEDPGLYHDIQALNPHMDEVHDAMQDALGRFVETVDDRDRFVEEMTRAHEYMEAYDWSRS